MKGNNAFGRAKALFALVLTAVQMHGPGTVALADALSGLPVYKSRGKGKTRRHDQGGTRAAQRAAVKRRNVLRNRSAHRG